MNWLCRLFGRGCPVDRPQPPSQTERRFDVAMRLAERRIESAERTTRRVRAVTHGRNSRPISSVFTDARKHLADPWENQL